MHFTKHYTIAEARSLLPQIRRWFDELDSNQKRLHAVSQIIDPMLEAHDDVGGEPANDLVRILANCKDTLQKFAEREIEIKDLDRGLIDFPALRNGQEIFLCWEKEEEDIQYWHDLESGYAGREPL